MRHVLPQLSVQLRLYFRNTMALLYGYLFPTIFLIAFWVLYRHEPVPLIQHMGELLTVTALGGACFGLPTTMVSERERGVWRRYRLAPISTASLVASTVLARYVLLISAALLQLGLALMIGMPWPHHLFALWLAFTVVSFAFLGLGLVIAMLADNVPAVQALGQSIFLPMLIIGGVAVQLESLPNWAQHLSAFFPGRYAVEAIQVSVNGEGLRAASFSLLALLLIGAAGCLAGSKLFRWDAHERFITRSGKGWLGVALAAWIAVGVLAEINGYVTGAPSVASANGGASMADTAPLSPADTGAAPAARQSPPADTRSDTVSTREAAAGQDASGNATPAATPDIDAAPSSWQTVTIEDIKRNVDFGRLPPDEGFIAPIAAARDSIPPDVAEQLRCVRANLPFWEPGKVEDPVQQARNYLYIAAVPDMYRMAPLERWVPQAVFRQLQYVLPRDQLTKVLYWIAQHPNEGSDAAADQLRAVCLEVGGPSNISMLRERVAIYARKLLGRLTGDIETPEE